MRNDKRACFAYVAATIVNKRYFNGVYDFGMSKYISISASSLSNSYLSFFDYNRGGYISGSQFSLYDYPTSTYVSININGNTIICFDFETSSYTNFVVNGSAISAFDYQTSKYYNYNVS